MSTLNQIILTGGAIIKLYFDNRNLDGKVDLKPASHSLATADPDLVIRVGITAPTAPRRRRATSQGEVDVVR